MKQTLPDNKQARTLPDQIVDLFIALIFTDDLKAGDRLPAELKLTKILQVNQSSLRMAMRVLTRMKVIESTRGSGLIVQDYKEQAELNFMTELVRIPELELGSDFLTRMLDSSTAMLFSQLMFQVTSKSPSHATRNYLPTLDQQISYLNEGRLPQEIAELDMVMQSNAAKELTNPAIKAMFNSIAPLRRHMMELYYAMPGNQLAHVEKQREIWLKFVSDEISLEEFNQRYLTLITRQIEALKEYVKTLPQKPRLKVSPLQHFPEMVSLSNYDKQ